MKAAFRKSVVVSVAALVAGSGFSGTAVAQESSDEASVATFHLDADGVTEGDISVVVEIDEESVLAAEQSGRSQSAEALEQARADIFEELAETIPEAEVNYEYDTVFSGFSLELPGEELYELSSVEGIKAVYPDVEYEVDSVQSDEFSMGEVSPEMDESAPFIGSDEAWEAGYTGEGVTVAILDTGVDYTHPDLAHAFGDYKGWDFIDNNDDPQETPPGDPRGGSTNHGTHVAGTVAANFDSPFTGVAPDATLLSYRVLGPGGSGSTQGVIAGIERAVEDGADVMNLSLGNATNDPDFATSLALDQAMADGVVAVSSNGNSGPNNWTVGSPGTSRDAISVGATQLPFDLYTAEVVTESGLDLSSAQVMGYTDVDDLLALNEGEYELVDAGLASEEEVAEADLEGNIALVERGEFAFVDKVTNAAAEGAVGVVMYNNVAGSMPEIPGMALPTLMLNQDDGQQLLSDVQAGNNTVSFAIEFDREVGETMADFSSRGPVMDTWMIKPDVSAPGVGIVSTVPTHNEEEPHGYASLQGTSMSAPHVAGAAALILEANPDWGVDFVKSSLMNTAENMVDRDGNPYAHNSQGAGSIRVLDAIETEVLVVPGSHSFGIFEKKNGRQVERQHFEIHNTSDEAKRYSLELTGMEGVRLQNSNNLRVQPGQSQNLNFGVQVDASSLEPGYHEGTIQLSDGSSTIEVPTILFVQQPDYPIMSQLSLSINSAGDLAGTVNLPAGADYFSAWIVETTGAVAPYETAVSEDVSNGIHGFTWDLTFGGETPPAGSYEIITYAKLGEQELYMSGGVLTLN
ncbi:S8 family serine peptidase [Alkalicoccus luteus]|uniref:S8 family serine peptidase n=1 Tax=Alkalicoccus luteus TaxID=1237094 RepID=A0A969PPP7_9BACI|nr:S8 family serine peptidase [Alkalicoccus luteus]NJP36136.1 S8 family serine peptidase [Alkalicoccus luteus]